MSKTNVLIREAREDDFEFVENLMQNALEAYYGGDHRAHAKRIFDAHIVGGVDRLGFFSFEQRTFITFAEMLNVEPWEKIAPDSKSQNEVLTLFKQIYPANKEQLGVVVFEFAQV